MIPIWQDTSVVLADNYGLFHIIVNGSQVYSGKVVPPPTSSVREVRINDIVADYLTPKIPSFGLTAVNRGVVVPVIVRNYSGTTVFNDYFSPDWSYDRDYNPDYRLPLAPIDNRLHPLQTFVFSNLSAGNIDVEVSWEDGMTDEWAGQYGEGVFSYMTPRRDSALEYLMLVLNAASTQYVEYKYTQGCERFVLYYINAYGGWESLLCDGTSTTSESYTRNTYKRVYDNNNALARGTVNYANEVAKTYTLRTGLLTEEGAANMHHLIGSPMVFLQDFANDGAVMPVTIDDKSVEAKTFNSNGRRPIQYTIKATLARDRVRR